jgi:hypothetical protein
MMNALAVHTESLMKILQTVLQQRMKQIGKDNWQSGRWVAIAFDGSRDSAPRTVANEAAFCAANYGHGKTAKFRKKKTKGMRRQNNKQNPATPPRPQVWITMMWHMGLRLPWTWRLGPSNTSERADVMDMVHNEKFPENTLFCGDAGFIGYPLWSAMVEAGYHFLVRVGGNVSLLTESGDCTLKGNQRVLSWPREAMTAGRPPLKLRLVRLRVGRTWMWLLTSVLDHKKLNLKEIREQYKQRWGIEVEFRGLKQTLDKRDLRCRNEARVKTELHWSLLAMALTELFTLKIQLPQYPPDRTTSSGMAVPQKRSLAESVRAIRWSLTHVKDVPDSDEKTLSQKLLLARTDDYERNAGKAARYRPPNPDKKPLGDPKIRRLKPDERKKLKAIKANNLTA